MSCPNISFTYLLSALLAVSFFFFNDTATTEIYTLSLHDALPISMPPPRTMLASMLSPSHSADSATPITGTRVRSEEHTSELQSPCNLVCRLLLEKKKINPSSRCRTLLPHVPCAWPRYSTFS